MQSRAKRLLIGCGLGCGTVVLLVVASCVSIMVWLNQPGELLEPDRLLGEETTGYVEWTLRSEDPGTMEFTKRLLDTIVEQQNRHRTPLPPLIDGWLSERQRRESEKDLNDLFPTVVAWTLRPGAPGEDDLHLLSASVASLGHRLILADLLLGFFFGWSEEIETVQHEGEKIYRFPLQKMGDVVFFIRRGSVFFTSDLETSRRALYLLNRTETAGRAPTELERLFARAPRDGSLRGALSNTHGELARLWDAWVGPDDPVDWSALVGVTLSGGFTASESLRGVVELHAVDASRAGALAPVFVGALREALADVPIELEEDVAGPKIAIRFSIDDIPQRLERLFNSLPQGRPAGR